MNPMEPMTPPDPFEDRVRDELGHVVDSYVPTPGLPERIEARTRERARDRARVLMGATAAAVVLVAGLVVVTRGGGDQTTRIASGPPAASSVPSTSVAGPATTIPAVQAPVSVTPAAVAPKSFLAAVGGGNEQAVVIDTATGHVARTLSAAPRGQEVWAVSVDGRTLYAPTQQASVCSRTYLAIDIDDGGELRRRVPRAQRPAVGRTEPRRPNPRLHHRMPSIGCRPQRDASTPARRLHDDPGHRRRRHPAVVERRRDEAGGRGQPRNGLPRPRRPADLVRRTYVGQWAADGGADPPGLPVGAPALCG